MVRCCARALALLTMVCWGLAVGIVPAAKGQEDNPFGASGKATLADNNPFGDAAPDSPKVAAAKTPDAPRPERPMSTNERVRETLHQPTRMEFIDMPLQDAMNFLRDFHQIEIQLDNRALEDAGVGSDTPVTRTLSKLPLKSALQLLLSDLDLTYVVQNDVLLITTLDKASGLREVRVYDVTKLVAKDAQAEKVGQTLVMLLGEAPQQGMPPGLQMIRIVPLGDLLVIRASESEHDEIVSIFQELAKALPDKD